MGVLSFWRNVTTDDLGVSIAMPRSMFEKYEEEPGLWEENVSQPI